MLSKWTVNLWPSTVAEGALRRSGAAACWWHILNAKYIFSAWAVHGSKTAVFPPAPQLTACHVCWAASRWDRLREWSILRPRWTVLKSSLIEWGLTQNLSTLAEFTVLTLKSNRSSGDQRSLWKSLMMDYINSSWNRLTSQQFPDWHPNCMLKYVFIFLEIIKHYLFSCDISKFCS